jgi:hypothetical protein
MGFDLRVSYFVFTTDVSLPRVNKAKLSASHHWGSNWDFVIWMKKDKPVLGVKIITIFTRLNNSFCVLLRGNERRVDGVFRQ